MSLPRWSKLSQTLHMSCCSSCRHSPLPSRGISHGRGGDRFPCSILALGTGNRGWVSAELTDRKTPVTSPFWKVFNMTSTAHTNSLFWNCLRSAALLGNPNSPAVLSVVPTTNIHCCFVQLQLLLWRDQGSLLERRNALLGKGLFPECHSGVTMQV